MRVSPLCDTSAHAAIRTRQHWIRAAATTANTARPAVVASFAAGTNPAADTRLGSSKTAAFTDRV
jgi:hypothetical protein